MLFVNDAFAQGSAVIAPDGGWAGLIPIALIFIVFYFMLIRPQHKKLKEHKEMVSNLKRGDKIITAGGVLGVIQKIDQAEDTALVEVAPEIRIKVIRSTISEVIGKSANEPAVKEEKA